ncbi:MAG TPA: CBS domain-containing protein [Gaiellaceae bacterium]|nr:CBS domain-containing protein [Gaiellaceae bacterium]
MRTLPDIKLVPASVPSAATFLEAAEALTKHSLPTIAVVGNQQRVVGLFGGEDLLRGLFPGYLAELRHTAFAADDPGVLAERARAVSSQPVEKYMRKPVTVDVEASAIHVAERFLHCDFAALAVVEDERFVGMLNRADFCRAVLRQT